MATQASDFFREQLEERKTRLARVQVEAAHSAELARLVKDVDEALERMTVGTFGICDDCHEPIEEERLRANPLARVCLEHLSAGERSVLEADLGLAARVQGAMLPERELRVNGWEVSYHYEAAGVVSGDYCDLIVPERGGKQFFFAVGDVSGKGLAASMLMTHLHAMLRSLVPLGLPMNELVGRVNTIFCESAIAGYYATLVCGRAGANGEVELCNAGHCQPIVAGPGGVRVLESTNVPVGLFCKGTYHEQRVGLAAGESLVLYTDGVTEAVGEGEEEYGTERLTQAVARANGSAAAAMVEACVADMGKFSNGAKQRDDRVVMAIRRAH